MSTAYPVDRLDTDRFGPFVFQLGLDLAALELPLVRVTDAHQRFVESPLAQVASQLEREVLVQSVHGTNTIEGAELSEEQTAHVLDRAPGDAQAEEQLRVRNIKAAYDIALARAVEPGWELDVAFVLDLHREICRDLPDPDNQPGVLRDNPKSRVTYVGDAAHGGRYKPPQFRGDIERLLRALTEWHRQLRDAGVSVLLRAPLVHLYFERIHPFWDGNGRVGRVLEATLLRQAGFRYAPFALSRHYLDEIDRYFTLFNTCRKADERGDLLCNQAFVAFHLGGMRLVIERLHGRVNAMVGRLLFDARIGTLAERREINTRQYTIVRLLQAQPSPLSPQALRREPWYAALYAKKTDKTRQRDLRGLHDLDLLRLDPDGMLRPSYEPVMARG